MTLFCFIVFANFIGLIPTSFSTTSHIAVTAVLAMLVFLGVAPIGAPIVGVLADLFGPAVSMVVGGTVSVTIAVSAAMLLGRSLGVKVRLRARRPFVDVIRDKGPERRPELEE